MPTTLSHPLSVLYPPFHFFYFPLTFLYRFMHHLSFKTLALSFPHIRQKLILVIFYIPCHMSITFLSVQCVITTACHADSFPSLHNYSARLPFLILYSMNTPAFCYGRARFWPSHGRWPSCHVQLSQDEEITQRYRSRNSWHGTRRRCWSTADENNQFRSAFWPWTNENPLPNGGCKTNERAQADRKWLKQEIVERFIGADLHKSANNTSRCPLHIARRIAGRAF